MPALLLMIVLFGALDPAASPAPAVRAVSTDGEATIYLSGDFAGGFSVAYNAVLSPASGNRSRVFVGVMLIGRASPGPSIEVGLARADPNGATLLGFTSVHVRPGASRYLSFPVRCVPACTLVLRGDRERIRAVVVTQGGPQLVGTWNRSDFSFVRPYMQVNGEVSSPGDRIAASLFPMRVVAASRTLPAPSCGFTTRGIEPQRLPGGTLRFSGTYRDGSATSYIDLRSGKMVDRCPK